MKNNLDDPKLTAYALGELSGEERSAMEEVVAKSTEAQAFVQETQQLSRLLRQDFCAELEGTSRKPSNILPLPMARSFWSDARWASIGVAALLAVGAVIAAVMLSGNHSSRPVSAAAPADVQMEILDGLARATPGGMALAEVQPAIDAIKLKEEEPFSLNERRADPRGSYTAGIGSGNQAQVLNGDPENSPEPSMRPRSSFSTAEYEHFDENPFLPALTNPLSTFSIDVDTASYANVRRLVNAGSLPPKDAVRIEEMINYFTYDYPQPEGDEAFSINLEVAGCPWQTDHRLVRIGLKGRDLAADKRSPSNLVFLLDVSGSMQPAERLPLIKQSILLLVDKLTEKDRVAIVVYAGSSGMALPSTPGNRKEEILAALEKLEAGGSTAGAAGIELAYKIAADNFIKGGVNRVILATDGDFNVGVTSQGELVRLAEEKAKGGVFLTVLGVGTHNLRDASMRKMADKGNGNYAYLDSLEEARKVLVQQMNGTLVTIAKDVKVQVEFNPARVASYRLIGYEKRALRKEDFNNDQIDAGEIGAGHTVTALYEIVPSGSTVNPAASVAPVDALKYQAAGTREGTASPELLTVKVRHKQPAGDQSQVSERPLIDNDKSFNVASADLKFAAAVAEFGMILRNSPHKGDATLGSVLELANAGRGRDSAGYRDGFITLVQKAERLAL